MARVDHIDAGLGSVAESLNAARSEQADGRRKSRTYVAYIEYFRALAIFIIVLGHCYALAWTHFIDEDLTTGNRLAGMIPALITGGTAYFVFISGFLYRQVFFDRVSYGDFMRKKALYVGLPYLVLATPLALIEIGAGNYSVSLYKDDVFFGTNVFMDYVVLLSTGRMATAYWYIPFIFIVFLASPLFDRFIRARTGAKAAIFAASLILALWVHRPGGNLDPVHSFLYFANFYLAGILVCENRAWIEQWTRQRPVLIMLTAALLAIAAGQALFQSETGNLERFGGEGWLPIGLDLMLFQKYVAILVFTAGLALWGDRYRPALSFVAAHSFGIFFIHPIVIAVMMRFSKPLSPHIGEPVADLALYGGFVFLLSLALAVLAKQVTGRYSRYLIGC